jgi:aspartyl/asparaginyl-tRNA synthetase
MFERTQIEEARRSLGEQVTLAGWVTRTRILRKISFIILRDTTGEIQVTVKDSELRSTVEDLGREDVVSVVGHVVESKVAQSGWSLTPG